MAYRFKLKEPLGKGISRVAREQIEQAACRLEDSADVHKSVHEARKALKRLRALLRLIRPALDKRTFEDEDRHYRAIARSLSGARDIAALLECLGRLEERYGKMGHNSFGGVLRSNLHERRESVASELNGAAREEALGALRKGRKRIGRLEVKGNGKGLREVRKGLQRSYDEGQRLSLHAWQGDDEDVHELRKAIQQHWRHMQLLAPAWPEVLSARVAAARELSELLGQDHDLSMLTALLASEGHRFGKASAGREFARLCRQRQSELRALAEPRTRRLYAEPAGTFARRIADYWTCARGIEPIEVKADADAHA